jgi:hypothetical protein
MDKNITDAAQHSEKHVERKEKKKSERKESDSKVDKAARGAAFEAGKGDKLKPQLQADSDSLHAGDQRVDKAARARKPETPKGDKASSVADRLQTAKQQEKEINKRILEWGFLPNQQTRDMMKHIMQLEKGEHGPAAKADNRFPPLDRTFESIKSPKDRDDALKNQDALREMVNSFGNQYTWFNQMEGHFSLGLDKDKKLSLKIEGQSLTDRAGDKLIDKLFDEGVNLLLTEVEGKAIEVVQQTAEALVNTQNEKMLGGISPEAKQWRRERTISLLAERLADKVVKSEWQKDRQSLNPVDVHDYLVQQYWKLDNALAKHIRYIGMEGDFRAQPYDTIRNASE